MKSGYYHHAIGDLRQRLNAAVPNEVLKALHRKSPWGHFAVALRQLVIFAGAFALSWQLESLWVRIPCALVLGFVVFDGTVLLHEVVHKAVFDGDRPETYRVLGLLYALPSGISPTQFTRWHLDHHAELGSPTDDPKRAHLSPKINARWLKLLYATPALFPIYFRAARKETATYPETLRRRIRGERLAAIALHLMTAVLIARLGGAARLVWLYLVPVFLVFPPAFALNRLGQHYDIVPAEPARWGTRMARSPFWEFVYLWSNLHLEHHYYPAVPFYRLPELATALVPFFEKEEIPPRRYRDLVRGWILENRAPHSDWSAPAPARADGPRTAPSAPAA
jgi:fatty acid desaturase